MTSTSTSSTNVEKGQYQYQNHNQNPIMSGEGEVEKGYYGHHEDMEMKELGHPTMGMGIKRKPVAPPVPPPKDGNTDGNTNYPGHEQDANRDANINAIATAGAVPGTEIFTPATFTEKIKLHLGLLDGNSEDKKARKQSLIVGVVGLFVVIAVVIGLAVGLTVERNKKSPSNLPLPTDNGGPYTGDLTYYDPALGSCGITSSASDPICAVSKDLYDAVSTGSNPNMNPLCGLKIRLRRDRKSVDVVVVDRCVGCKPTDIDVSMSVFEQLALVEQGRVLVDWAWIDETPF